LRGKKCSFYRITASLHGLEGLSKVIMSPEAA
jgi:hypothetical protein